MTVFQNELDDATINALPKLMYSVSALLRSRQLTVSVVEAATQCVVSHSLASLPGSDDFFVGSLFCNHSVSYIQLLGVSPVIVRDQYKDPDQFVSALLQGVQKRLRSSIYIVVYGALKSVVTDNHHSGKLFLGFQLGDKRVIKSVPVEGTMDSVKQRMTFIVLTYLKNYLAYQENTVSTELQYA